MTNPYRALCAELIDSLENARRIIKGADGTLHINTAEFVLRRARALLAEPVAEGPSVLELEAIELALWDKYRTKGWGGGEFMYDNNFSYALEEYRAALARWGRPAAAPVPEPGEVGELVADLQEIGEILCGMEKHRWAVKLTRAAALLQQQAAPVPVSERLPGPEDCDAEGRCWRYIDPEESLWHPMWELARSKYAVATYGSVAWLPANALPLPAPEGGEAS